MKNNRQRQFRRGCLGPVASNGPARKRLVLLIVGLIINDLPSLERDDPYGNDGGNFF